MNISALEKMNKNKELADKICNVVDLWLDYVKIGQDRNYKVDLRLVGADDWLDLQSRIERLLEE